MALTTLASSALRQSAGVAGRVGLPAHGLARVVAAAARLLDHAVDDAIDRITLGEGAEVDVLEPGAVEPVLPEALRTG